MRGAGRANHPSRLFARDTVSTEFKNRHLNWLDIGTVGMVNYERLSDSDTDFTYTGVDVSPPIIEDSKLYLRNDSDRILEWDIQQSLDAATPFESSEKFDLLTYQRYGGSRFE